MRNSVVDLFQGLTTEQAQELRERMLPALFDLREEIVNPYSRKRRTMDQAEARPEELAARSVEMENA